MKQMLFVCRGNSCLSQMAEGWAIRFLSHQFHIDSAGSEPREIHPLTYKVMHEVGVDISNYESKSIDHFVNRRVDYIISVYEGMDDLFSQFPDSKVLAKPFPNPVELIAEQTDSEQQLEIFRKTRDEIRNFIFDIKTNIENY